MFSRLVEVSKNAPQTDNDLNLLLLGESDKENSTFINSIPNYFKYSGFQSAWGQRMEILSPVRINLPNSHGQLNQGAASTHQLRIFLFPVKTDGRVVKLTVVEVPTEEDPRGSDQDNTNFDNILAYLATLKKLHGICLVLKPYQVIFNNFIKNCLGEILKRLDKSASENVIFVSTYCDKKVQNTPKRAINFCLERLVQHMSCCPPYATILLNQNVFFVDNKGFKALVEMNQGKHFEQHELSELRDSWNVSSQECRRFLTYITGDSKTPPLKPYILEKTLSLDEIKYLIEQLTTPLAEISAIIQDNLRLLDLHQKNLNLETMSIYQLKSQLYIPCVELKVTEVDRPVTVCTDPKCADVVKVNGVTKLHYRQKCHNPCALTGIPKEVIGDPGLVSCFAINHTGTCIQCGCHWQVHMQIYKTTEKIEVKKEDDNVKTAIQNKEDVKVQIETYIKALHQRRQELEKESNVISESIAKFSYFLQQHAMTPINDSYSDYIQHLIKNEQSLGEHADSVVIDTLRKLIATQEHLLKTFQENSQKFGQNRVSSRHQKHYPPVISVETHRK